jgi:hypothetical protein
VEHFFSHLADAGPWVASAVGTVVSLLLRSLIKELRALKDTQMKAELAYDEVSQRVPEVKMKYEFWQAHR